MFNSQFFLGTAMIIGTVLFHIAGLVVLAAVLKRFKRRSGQPQPRVHSFGILCLALFAIIFLHTAEGWSWALAYYLVGEFSQFTQALYFSFVTATTLGYGDLTLSPEWQLFGTFESMGGLILFGASTAFLMEVCRSAFYEEFHDYAHDKDTTR